MNREVIEPAVSVPGGRAGARGILAWVLPALLVGSFALCYAGVFAALAANWAANDVYSFGWLIPPISLYLAWARRERLGRLPASPGWVAGGILLGYLLTHSVPGKPVHEGGPTMNAILADRLLAGPRHQNSGARQRPRGPGFDLLPGHSGGSDPVLPG